MKPMRNLGQQIVWSMVASTLCGVSVMVVGFYFFYGLALWLVPQHLSTDESWFPSGLEWLLVLMLLALGAGLAFFAAVRLARKIVGPLTAVAESAERIANGELSARAIVANQSIGEASLLVSNFNEMADSLERASEGVSSWNALIAHELRTPVTILRGRVQGLADGVFAPDPRLFQSLLKQIDGLGRLVEDLRTVSLFDAGQLALVTRDVELATELESCIQLMQPFLNEAGFTVSTEFAPGRCAVDPTRLNQAVMALLQNALRHAKPGALRITFSLSGDEGEITVCDRGPGLPADFQFQAFQPFQRRMQDDRSIGGSGLGLAVVRAVAQAHGGEASYEDKNGGACFRMRFLAPSIKHSQKGRELRSD